MALNMDPIKDTIEDNLSPKFVRIELIKRLQRYFMDHKFYKWNPDRNTTELYIQQSRAIEARHGATVPTVLVESSGVSLEHNSTNNISTLWNSTGPLHPSYKVNYTSTGMITIFCITNSPVASEDLAWEIFTFMAAFRTYVGKVIPIQYMSSPQISQAQKIRDDSFSGDFVATVTVSYNFATSLSINPILEPGEVVRHIDGVIKTNNLDSELPDNDSDYGLDSEEKPQVEYTTCPDKDIPITQQRYVEPTSEINDDPF